MRARNNDVPYTPQDIVYEANEKVSTKARYRYESFDALMQTQKKDLGDNGLMRGVMR